MASLACYILPLLLILISVSSAQFYEGRNSVTSLQKYYDHAPPRPPTREMLGSDELQLLDTVVLASVDGRFHALNRTTGRMVWSMEQPIPNPNIDKLADLVRTDHGSLRQSAGHHYDPDEGTVLETYIIEPQSGHIFVNPADAKREDPIQRLPFSMAQLVEMSPFRLDDHRTFVGKKKTSLITLDLGTGEVLDILDPEQCSWNDQPSAAMGRKNLLVKDEELLDELDSPEVARSLVHIGRTDYHVSVFSHGRIIQNLTFSSYGPNNLDKDMQYLWRRTPDNWYHQPTPDGTLLMFKTDEREPFRSFIKLKRPIVAVFDTVSLADRSDPLILLQPAPSLNDLYPTRLKELRELSKQDELTVVGRIGDSLYAMSHHTFSHVIFSRFPSLPTIEFDSSRSEHLDPDEQGVALEEVCTSLECLVGVHKTESAGMSRLSRLLAGSTPSHGALGPIPTLSPHHDGEDDRIDGRPTTSSPPIVIGTPRASTVPSYPSLDPPPGETGFWAVGQDFKNPLFTGLLGLIVFAWIFAKRIGEIWKARRISPVSRRDIPHQDIILPSHSVSDVEPLRPVIVESKPLPPVPLDLSELAELEKSLDEPGEGDDDGETEKENGDSDKNGKRKGPKRRKRGKGGKKNVVLGAPKEDEHIAQSLVSDVTITQTTPNAVTSMVPSQLVVSDTILGYGSHGTIVYQGAFQGRAVAVKRLLQDFVTLASREVALLQESDDHPNVIRYYFKENKDNFLYIALELCPASLADIVERPNAFPEISAAFDPKRALAQVTNGLRHLHSLKIVHRDIKPQNILVSKPGNSATTWGSSAAQYRMLISDFGLCRKLESDQTSFLPTIHSGGGTMAAGTVGWRAPEILRGEVKLDEATLDMSSGGTPNSSVGGTGGIPGRPGSNVTRLTKSVDVFALGCLFYYTLTGGDHPYGERFEREVNILKNVMKLDRLDPLGEEGAEAGDLIAMMLDQEPKSRPDTTSCLIHPYFWTPARRLGFLQDASDRFEIMQREPREPQLVVLETNALVVVGPDWHKRLDKTLDENLGKFRKYDGRSVQDLLRALRNKKHHYQDLPDNVKRALGVFPEGYLAYFTRRFPRLFLHVYSVVAKDPLLQHDNMFKSYFDYGGD